MIIFLLVVFGGVFGWDMLRSYFMQQYFAHYQPPPASVSTVIAKKTTFNDSLKSVGTLVAVNGVSLSPQVAGIITQIHFKSGQMVQKGELLVKLDDSIEQAELKNSEAALKLAQLDFKRNQDLLKKNAASQSEFDKAQATLSQDQASVEKIKAMIAQKNIVAPFSGRIGVREVNLGQYVSAGTSMVTLQAMNPIFINFYLPEQDLPKLTLGQKVIAKVDTYPSKAFAGKISAINSEVNTSTHNVLVQATFQNSDQKLYPGLFANVSVIEKNQSQVVLVPSTAINFSLFGNSVFVVEKNKVSTEKGQRIYPVKQVFVKTGQQNSQSTVVLSGVKAGESVVSSGQLKLHNGSKIVIDNKVQLVQKQNEIY